MFANRSQILPPLVGYPRLLVYGHVSTLPICADGALLPSFLLPKGGHIPALQADLCHQQAYASCHRRGPAGHISSVPVQRPACRCVCSPAGGPQLGVAAGDASDEFQTFRARWDDTERYWDGARHVYPHFAAPYCVATPDASCEAIAACRGVFYCVAVSSESPI